LTPGYDEANYRLANTPEGYLPQKNMISWDEQGLNDYPMEYASISNGEETSIKGRIYVSPESIGNHYILVRTYDARMGDPFTDDVQPLQEKLIPLDITTIQEQTTIFGMPNLLVFLLLGILTFAAIVYVKKEGSL
jgi:hypothetical protein